ncbi:MAG: Mrp/NBP35 family ATP-binding protein [Phycisphaerae bacterium]|nr:Mrp/NBP35 family ATP-binding protein [Phycisphaerae bacterium]
MTDKCDSSCSSCSSDCSDRKTEKPADENQMQINGRLAKIKNTIVVMSGKGGVGKTTVAANLAMSLAMQGKKVGLLDADIHGPSMPTVLGARGKEILVDNGELLPAELTENLKMISVGLLLPNFDDAVVWRGPMKNGVINQFLRDVRWGDLDYLIIDLPPGTGDESMAIVDYIKDATGAIIVTTPQEVSLADVRKSVNFCHKVKLNILGVIENMSGFACPCCNTITEIFKSGGGEKMAADMNIKFLGKVPIDPEIANCGDDGKAFVEHFPDSVSAKVFKDIIEKI